MEFRLTRWQHAAWQAKIDLYGREMVRSRKAGDDQRVAAIGELLLAESRRLQRQIAREALVRRLDGVLDREEDADGR